MAGVATGVTVWLVIDSVVLAVFWALVASYVVATIAPTRPREPLVRRRSGRACRRDRRRRARPHRCRWDVSWLARAVALTAGAVAAGIGEATR